MLPIILAVGAAGAAWGATTYTAESVAEASATDVVVSKVENLTTPIWQRYGLILVVVLLFIAWRRGWV
ncbi:hypothetical protein CW749_22480 [Vibrio sp. vnigr-6D03]|nr:hypothetical protein CW749_22480 [Vibrio sp. vnigr-6D03]